MNKTRYAQCTYSLFISYAHNDDSGHGDWVRELERQIFLRMNKLGDRKITKLPTHYSGRGPNYEAGADCLAQKLPRELGKSFAMLIVVGPNYVTSKYCADELRAFSDRFGGDCYAERLYIAVMGQCHLTELRKGTYGGQWRSVIGDDRLYVAMHQDAPNQDAEIRPTLTRRGASGVEEVEVNPRLRDGAWAIADRLIDAIVADHASDDARLADLNVLDSGVRGPWAPPTSERLRIAIGPPTETLQPLVAPLAKALGMNRADVSVLDAGLLDDWDPDDSDSRLKQSLAEVDALVVPYADEEPRLGAVMDGGHMGILAHVWKSLDRPRPVFWYRPPGVASARGPAKPKHRAMLEQLWPVCYDEAGVIDQLFGQGHSRALRLIVNDMADGTQADRVGNLIQRTWARLRRQDAMRAQSVPRPKLKCVPIHPGALKEQQRDGVVGVILVYYGRNLDSLHALKDAAEQLLEDNDDRSFPGMVAAMLKKETARLEVGIDWRCVKFDADHIPLHVFSSEDDNALRGWLDMLWDQQQGAQSPRH